MLELAGITKRTQSLFDDCGAGVRIFLQPLGNLVLEWIKRLIRWRLTGLRAGVSRYFLMVFGTS